MLLKTGKALIAGAGISGIRAALDLAETGFRVTLIDRSPHIGGVLSLLDQQFPTNSCGMCKMLPLVERDRSSQLCLRKGLFHENIDIRPGTRIVDVQGEPGAFTVTLEEKPTCVDSEKCVGCGVCTDVCPVEVPDDFNLGMSLRKAIYLPVPHNIPNAYVVDPSACTSCGECVTVCPTDAIELLSDKRKGFHILVVDDELSVRDSLKEWLVEEGFSVDTAASGADALDKLARGHVDLMLTDIKMPGMDGVTLLKKAIETVPELCVLMMTAYATVETAVEAMKVGARDYLMKPFDPEAMISKVVNIYQDLETGDQTFLDVGSIIFCGGTDYFDPASGKDLYGYGINPHVITNLALERILSMIGPSSGKLIRPHDNKPVNKIAWLQCIGSRDLQCDSDFCSSVCCMIAIKEALLAKERGGNDVQTTLFYMDIRTPGKSFQRYRDAAEKQHGVKFYRTRVHSVITDLASGDPAIRYMRNDGSLMDETFDLVVLSLGQQPSPGNQELSEMMDVSLNPWGFVETEPFFPAATTKPGIMAGGSFSGLKEISESIIHASAASVEASRLLHSKGQSLSVEPEPTPDIPDVSGELPRIMVAICTCADRLHQHADLKRWSQLLEKDLCIHGVFFIKKCCTKTGWEELAALAKELRPNRILLGACHPCLFTPRLKTLGKRLLLDDALMDVVDILSPVIASGTTHYKDSLSGPYGREITENISRSVTPNDDRSLSHQMFSRLEIALSGIKHVDPLPIATIPVKRSALVVGGGIGGMQAALAIADHGYPVDIIEQQAALGGNLCWLIQTIEGHSIPELLGETIQKIENHPLVNVHCGATLNASFGEVGNFSTTVTDPAEEMHTLQHGAIILATGGIEAATTSYGYGKHPAIITQKTLEQKLGNQKLDLDRLTSIVMIQCVDSREEPRNYCSRVCCPTSLKHALKIKRLKPGMEIYILYRDMMTPGFSEKYFTRARRHGVIFIQYDPQTRPNLVLPSKTTEPLHITTMDPLLNRPLNIRADLLVLATGIVPKLPAQLADQFGVRTDQDGFFQEADSKWRPVDALKEGVFACGMALSPRSIPDTIASAGAAAQRALRILSHKRLPAGKSVASVRQSLCILCEQCIDTCPYGARRMNTDNSKILINPVMCQGCGDCATVCPSSAAVVNGFLDQQVMDMVDTALSFGGEP